MNGDPFTYRPIDQWPGDMTPDHHRRRSPFSAGYGTTLQQLDHELGELGARNVVLQVALTDADIRLDGRPRAKARAHHPGVILAFDSHYGPLKYAVDTFTTWEANIRAIALALEALRKVDRYGVTKRGEQYTGWRALPAAAGKTSESAADTIWRLMPTNDDRLELTRSEIARSPMIQRAAYRRAATKHHPDAGGDPADWRQLQCAKEALEHA